MNPTIYHNAACNKSTGALALLKQHGVAADIVNYLAAPPTVADLKKLSQMLGVGPLGMMRTTDKDFLALGLSTADQRSDDAWFELIVQHPILLQRPIVVVGDRAIIARPAELVLKLLPDAKLLPE